MVAAGIGNRCRKLLHLYKTYPKGSVAPQSCRWQKEAAIAAKALFVSKIVRGLHL